MSAGPIRTMPIDARISYSASGLQDHCGDAVTPLVHFVVWRNSIPAHEVQMHAHHARQLAAFLLAAADDADGVAPTGGGDAKT